MKKAVTVAAAALCFAASAEIEKFTLVKDGAAQQTKLEACSAEYVKSLRDLTDRRIKQILETPNMKAPAGVPCYYLSEKSGDDGADGRTPATAWKTTARLDAEKGIKPGSFVFFERGGVYRNGFDARQGVTYTAYGTGPKPHIYSSPADGSVPSKWKPSGVENVWVYDEIGTADVGTMVFNHGEAHAIKILPVYEKDGTCTAQYTKRPFRDYRDLDTDLHFWHDYARTKLKDSTGNGKLYLYSKQNPGERFKSIEFLVRKHGVRVGRANNVTIDNLAIKYVGSHGVGAGMVNGLKVQNCEFGWIGGSIQAEGLFGRRWAVRFGNAVEIWGGCEDYSVDNCYIYQVYDAGVTHQYAIGAKNKDKRFDMKNVRYSNNVIEKCNYSIEYFLAFREAPENPSRMENVLFENNLMWDAGTGLCEQRPDVTQAAHIKSWEARLRNRAKNFVIRNNLMARSKVMLLQMASSMRNEDGSESMPFMEGNVVIGRREGQRFGGVKQDSACVGRYTDDSQAELNARGPGNRALVLQPVAGLTNEN